MLSLNPNRNERQAILKSKLDQWIFSMFSGLCMYFLGPQICLRMPRIILNNEAKFRIHGALFGLFM